MPGLDGFKVCSRLKADEKTKDIPVIILTSLEEEKDLSKGLEQGAHCFIRKPFNSVDLLNEIKTAWQKKNKGSD